MFKVNVSSQFIMLTHRLFCFLVKHLELKSALDKIAGTSINAPLTLPQLKAYTKWCLPDDLKEKFFNFIFNQFTPSCNEPSPNDFKVSVRFNQIIMSTG